jgi:hypothetical protein
MAEGEAVVVVAVMVVKGQVHPVPEAVGAFSLTTD